jgi:hypothetical protein
MSYPDTNERAFCPQSDLPRHEHAAIIESLTKTVPATGICGYCNTPVTAGALAWMADPYIIEEEPA